MLGTASGSGFTVSVVERGGRIEHVVSPRPAGWRSTLATVLGNLAEEAREKAGVPTGPWVLIVLRICMRRLSTVFVSRMKEGGCSP